MWKEGLFWHVLTGFVTVWSECVRVLSHGNDFTCYHTVTLQKIYYKNSSLYRQNEVEHLYVHIKMFQLHEKDQLYTNVYFFPLLVTINQFAAQQKPI